MKLQRRAGLLVAVGGGKGGVGKSIFSVALAVTLARRGASVILADLDLGAANLHTYLGMMKKTPTIADFILRKVPALEDVLLETPHTDMKFISGAEFVPGMANPAHWMKLKIIRHLKALPADYLVMDLGAGVHFNVLDFFCTSDIGVVMTAPEPGAVMNAYGFIKGALFRKIQNVFRRHPVIGPVIEEESARGGGRDRFNLEWFSGRVLDLAPDIYPLIEEIGMTFRPHLVVNRVPHGRTHILVKNLLSLCAERLGVELDYTGNLPEVEDMSSYLLNVPSLLDSGSGAAYSRAVSTIADMLSEAGKMPVAKESMFDFSDEEIEKTIQFIDSLDEEIFADTSRELWKLRMFFKPQEVVDFLVSRGVTYELFAGYDKGR